MMKKSRLEINFRRLLSRCELLTKEQETIDWRLEKYIESLQDMLNALEKSISKPDKDVLLTYSRRVEFLKGILNTTKLSNPIERVIAVKQIPVNLDIPLGLKSGQSTATQIHQKTTAKYEREIRDKLFQTNSGNSNDLRNRLNDNQHQDLDSCLKQNSNEQEIITRNMLYMTSSMKENALTANTIISQDLRNLEKSNSLTDVNASKLKKVSIKLEEHTKSSWRCFYWLFLALVLVIFFYMVLFIRVTKRRT